MYLLSDDHLMQMTCCMRLVWYTSLCCKNQETSATSMKSRQKKEDMQYKHLYIATMQDCKINSGRTPLLLSRVGPFKKHIFGLWL